MLGRFEEQQLRLACQEVSDRLIAGECAVAEKVLERNAEFAANPDQAIELIFAEFATRETMGQRPQPSEFIERFPQWSERLDRLFRIHQALGDEPAPDSFRDTARAENADIAPESVPDHAEPPARSIKQVGDYEILEEIGRGGMGVVYKARHRILGRIVALKELLATFGSSEHKARLLREAAAVARLQHPHVVQIYDVGDGPNGPYMAMEWLTGGSLDKKVASEAFTARVAAELVRSLARAMDYAHRRGVIHRDLKPANVLLTDAGEVKITDFGLAKMLTAGLDVEGDQAEDWLTHTGAILGTPCYMAPEQVRGDRAVIGATSDVYALGAILYELLTGRPPFRGDTPLETFRLICDTEALPPRHLHHKLPKDLGTICLRCLEKEPRRRYVSTAALASDLDSFLRNKPIRARPVGVTERSVKWVTRHPMVAALLAVLLLVGSSGIVGVASQWRRAVEGERRAVAGEKAQAAAREQAEAGLYFNRIALAHRALRDNDTTRAKAILYQCNTNYRHWEWNYLNRLCRNELHTLSGHTNYVGSVVFTPDGKHIVSASGNVGSPGEVIIWDAQHGREINRMVKLSGRGKIDVSADGELIAIGVSGGRNGLPTASLWDSQLGTQVRTLPIDSGVTILTYSPDGKLLATGDGKGRVRVWDVKTGVELKPLGKHGQFVTSVCFGPDGRTLGSGSRDRSVYLWNVADGELLHAFRAESDVRSVAVSPDGAQLVATGYGGWLTTWDLTQDPPWKIQSRKCGADTAIFASCFRSDGLRLALACEDGTVQVIDNRSGRSAFLFSAHQGHAAAVQFDPEGRRIACGIGKTVRVWDLRDRRSRVMEDRDFRWATDIDCHPDGKHALIATQWHSRDQYVVVMRNLITGRDRMRLAGHDDEITALAVSHDGQRLASASKDKTVRVWNLEDGRALHTFQHDFAVNTVALPLDGGNTLVSGDDAGNLKLWDLSSGNLRTTVPAHETGVLATTMHPGGRFLVTAAEDSLKLWQIENWKAITFSTSATAERACARFSPDGQHLASSHGKEISLWRISEGPFQPPVHVAHLEGHHDAITSLTFSPDGRRLGSTGSDYAVRLWDVPTGFKTLVLEGVIFDNIYLPRIAFSADGQQLVSVSSTRVKVWDTGQVAEPSVDVAQLEVEISEHYQLVDEYEAKGFAAKTARNRLHDDQFNNRCWKAAAFHRRKVMEKTARIAEHDLRSRTQLLQRRCYLAVAEYRAGNRQATFEQLAFAAEMAKNPATSLDAKLTLAWYASTYPMDDPFDPDLAMSLATDAIHEGAANAGTWTTLGIARYRAGLFDEAVEALDDSIRVGSGKPTPRALAILAMAHYRRGDHGQAQRRLHESESWFQWHAEHKPLPTFYGVEIAELIDEAQTLLGSGLATNDAEPTSSGGAGARTLIHLDDDQLLKIAHASEGRFWRQEMRKLFGPSWSGDSQLVWLPERPGTRLTLSVTVPADGSYLIRGRFTQAHDYGQFQLHVNGQMVGGPFDAFNAGRFPDAVIHSGDVMLGSVPLRAGTNEFVFEIVGKSPESVGHLMGIDELELELDAVGP